MGWLTNSSTEVEKPQGLSRLARKIAGIRVDVSFAIVDGVIVAVSYLAALVIRFTDRQGSIADDWWEGFWLYLPVVITVHLVANALLGAYGHVWEFASVEEAMRLVAAVVLSSMTLFAGLLTIQEVTGSDMRLIPITVILIGSGVALGGMGAVRFRSRLFSFRRTSDRAGRTALVVGTGRAAADLARRGRTADTPTIVLGFVDDRPDDRQLAGVDVLGGVADLPELIAIHHPDEVVMAASVGPQTIRRVVDLCIDIDVGLRTLPDLTSTGAESMRDVRDLELADLLPRPTVTTDLSSVGEIVAGRRVLVTGAGGSIGSEIVRQVAALDPKEVIALDHDEGHLYEASLGWAGVGSAPLPILVDICDRSALDRVFQQQRPDVVFHAAAHKHVPILEIFPEEAVKTNVVGTANLVAASRATDVERFVLISTDKAVEPSSVMGASKRVAELIVQSAAATTTSRTIFSAVRFGNVLGSRGSVVPTFMRQIKDGGPVTVSDPMMLRFFMLTSEAVELVLQAAALSRGGEIFVLDMGEAVRIGDLAHRMIRLAGLVPGRDIEVKVVGARPGEKVVEILSDEPLLPSTHPQISLAAATRPGPITLRDAVNMLESLAIQGQRAALREVLMALSWRHWSSDETIDLAAVVGHALEEPA